MATTKKAGSRSPPARAPAKKAATRASAPTQQAPQPAPRSSPTSDWAAAPPAALPRAFDERQYAMFLHLSALAGLLFVGGLAILGPLVMWMVKKDQSSFVDRHGRAAVNFHLSIILYAVIGFVFAMVLIVATLGFGIILLLPLMFLAAFAFVILVIVFPILAGLKANEGKEYHYPLSIRFIKDPITGQ